jgi:hypothetical protein
VSDISDHFPNFIQLPSTLRKNYEPPPPTRNFSRANLQRFKDNLNATSWITTYNALNVNDSYKEFWTHFSNLFEIHFPLTTQKRNRNTHKINPYMTKGLLISRISKNNLYKLQISSPSVQNKTKYKNYRNIYNTLIRKSRQLYYTTNLYNCRNDPRKTWEILREATTGPTPNKKITEIMSNGNIMSNPNIIAEEFNTFFTKIGKDISNSIQPTDKDPISYINVPENIPILNFNRTDPGQIIGLLKNFENKTSPDADGITLKLIKFIAPEIAQPLSHIFNLSLEQGTFPEAFKCARVVPIYKTGDQLLCNNYRPIALVKTFSKILEKIVQISLVNHIEINNLLYKHQYGFRHGKSTEHNLIHIFNHIAESLNNGEITVGVFLDLKKAFDVCDHQILLRKLNKYGISGVPLDWFTSYLTGRTQVVDIQGHFSSAQSIDISVIQGSLLGPILFSIYINDFPNCTSLYSFLFADDTSLLKSGKNLIDITTTINNELINVATWYRANKMAVNTDKTKYVIFHQKGKKIPNNTEIIYNNNDPNTVQNPLKIHTLERISSNNTNQSSKTYKLLGILLDENLNLNAHYTNLRNKLSRALFFLRRARNFLPERALLTLYYSLFHCHLLYCPVILSTAAITNINSICTLQRKAIRIITKSHRRADTTPIFKDLQILPFNELIKFSKCMLMHSIHYNYNQNFTNVWTRNNQRNHDINLRNDDEYYLPQVNKEFFRRSTLYSIPNTWNALGDIKFQQNRTTFKINLLYDLFESLTD